MMNYNIHRIHIRNSSLHLWADHSGSTHLQLNSSWLFSQTKPHNHASVAHEYVSYSTLDRFAINLAWCHVHLINDCSTNGTIYITGDL